MKYTSSEQELYAEARIRAEYNAGNCALAVELATEFYQHSPHSPLAKYLYAAMHGDYSYDSRLPKEEKDRFLHIARQGIKELFEDPDRHQWPAMFAGRVQNEYYWFFELYDEQYKLGLMKNQEAPGTGDYSCCVGASMLALKKLRAGDSADSEEWARVSLKYFAEFERHRPDWYNINYFSAQAYACLGEYDKALVSFQEMFRKQKAPENQNEIQEFLVLMEEVRNLRAIDPASKSP